MHVHAAQPDWLSMVAIEILFVSLVADYCFR